MARPKPQYSVEFPQSLGILPPGREFLVPSCQAIDLFIWKGCICSGAQQDQYAQETYAAYPLGLFPPFLMIRTCLTTGARSSPLPIPMLTPSGQDFHSVYLTS